MFCNKCGKDFGNVNIKFCPYCGSRTGLSQGTRATATTKAEAPKTNNGRSHVNKTAIIIVIIIAVAAVTIVFMFINNNSLNSPKNDRDLVDSGGGGKNESPTAAGIKIEKVGDIVEFGTWQGEPIEWRVLNIEKDRALLISKDILTVRQYDGLKEYGGPSNIDDWNDVKVTWAKSDIRAWLNDDFLNEAFSKSEQKSILISEIATPDNAEYRTDGGRDTEDKIFLLSIDETDRYFRNDDDRRATFKMTEEDIQYILKTAEEVWFYDKDSLNDYEKSLREDFLGQRQAWGWWLRSPGDNRYSASLVFVGGGICDYGLDVYYYGDNYSFGVRPAFYINLKL